MCATVVGICLDIIQTIPHSCKENSEFVGQCRTVEDFEWTQTRVGFVESKCQVGVENELESPKKRNLPMQKNNFSLRTHVLNEERISSCLVDPTGEPV